MREAGSKPRLEKPAGRPPISKFPARGSRPKTENKGFAGGRARTMPAAGPPNPKHLARGSRPETENKGFAGSRARTMPAGGPPLSKHSARGSRPETENKGLAGSRARTMSAGRPPIPKFPTRPPHKKRRAAARRFSLSSYLLIFLSSYPVIYSSGLRSIPSNPSRYAFSSGSTSEMPPSWVASTFSGSTGSCRDFRRRNQPVCPFKS